MAGAISLQLEPFAADRLLEIDEAGDVAARACQIITAVIALLAVAFAITLGVLLTDLWPWVRKRPNAPKGNDDA